VLQIDNPVLPEHVRHSRQWPRGPLERHSFKNLPEERWHYTLRSEPYPNRYCDFRSDALIGF